MLEMNSNNKRIALIGSSGGGAATLGHTNPMGFVELLSRHLSDGMNVDLAFVVLVSTNDGSGLDGATGEENVSLLYRNGKSQDAIHGTLDTINQNVAELEKLLALEIEQGNIDGMISVSCKPSLFQKTFDAAAAKNIPVTGTGGSSLSEASSIFKLDLIGNAGGSVATTAETKAISFVSAFARHWGMKYSPRKANATRKIPTWRSVLCSCLPAFWAVCLLKRLVTTTKFTEYVPVSDALLFVLEAYALPVVCCAIMATSRRHTESALMAAILAGTACRKTVLGGLFAGWLVTVFEEHLLYFCLLHWNVPATFINLLTSGLVGIVVAGIMWPMAAYFSTATEYYRTTVLGFVWKESEEEIETNIRLLFHSFLGCIFCYGSKIGWYHSIFLPLILIEMELGDPSILGTLDFLSLVLVCSGVCMGLLVTGYKDDKKLAKRGLAINLLCGDFIEACYPHMEKNWIVSMGGYLGSATSATLLSSACKSSAYLPFPISVWLADEWETLLLASSFAFGVPFVATLLSYCIYGSKDAEREDLTEHPKSSNDAARRKQQSESATSTERKATSSTLSSSSSYYMVLAVKILLVLIILLWLPPLVTSKKKRRNGNSGKTMVQRLHRTRLDCEVDCVEWAHRQGFPSEESMNCIFHCMSPACFGTVYTTLLEPGEVDIQRYDLFEACAQEEIKEARRQRAVEKKKT